MRNFFKLFGVIALAAIIGFSTMACKSLSGETVSIGSDQFVTTGSEQLSVTITGISSGYNGKYGSVVVYNKSPGNAVGATNRILITGGTFTAPLFDDLIIYNPDPLYELTPGTYDVSLFMYDNASGGAAVYQSYRFETTITAEKNTSIAFSNFSQME